MSNNKFIPVRCQIFLNNLKKSTNGQAFRLSEAGEIFANWRGWKISSVFQPIIPVGHTTDIHGYEAFLRCVNSDGIQITPRGLFSNTSDDESLMHLDRLCRTVHLLNFIVGSSNDKKLFLNVHDGLVFAVVDNHGSSFRKVVDALGFSSKRVVIELPLELSKNLNHLSFVLQNYRLNSLDIAINIDSVEKWLSLPQQPKVSYIKIARNVLDSDLNTKLKIKSLLDSDPDVKIIVTKNESYFEDVQDDRLLVQGFSYGLPEKLSQNENFLKFISNDSFIDVNSFIGG